MLTVVYAECCLCCVSFMLTVFLSRVLLKLSVVMLNVINADCCYAECVMLNVMAPPPMLD